MEQEDANIPGLYSVKQKNRETLVFGTLGINGQ